MDEQRESSDLEESAAVDTCRDGDSQEESAPPEASSCQQRPEEEVPVGGDCSAAHPACADESSDDKDEQQEIASEADAAPEGSTADSPHGLLESVRKRPVIYGAIAGLVLLMVGLVWSASTALNVREPGAWPDMPYLASLDEDAELFVRAMNCEELTEQYQQAKRDGTWDEPINVTIDIDELEERGINEEMFEPNPQLMVVFEEEGRTVGYFALFCSSPVTETFPSYDAEGNPCREHVLVYLDCVYRLTEGAVGISQSDADLEKIIRAVSDQCDYVDPLINEVLNNPDLLAGRAGIDLDKFSLVDESHSSADWGRGYVRSCMVNIAAGSDETPPVRIGSAVAYAYNAGSQESGGGYFVSIMDFDDFTWTSSEVSDLTVSNMGLFSIGYRSRGYAEDEGAAQPKLEDMVGSVSMDLWSVE